MTGLNELYIAENFLEQIDGLDTLTNLELLDLSMNKITKLGGISKLKQLKELWVMTFRKKQKDLTEFMF